MVKTRGMQDAMDGIMRVMEMGMGMGMGMEMVFSRYLIMVLA